MNLKILIPVILFIMLAFILGKGLNPMSYRLTPLETNKVFLRTGYFSEEIGKVYKKRFGLFYLTNIYTKELKFQTVFFSSLDPVLIFLPLYGFLLIWGYKKIR